jgi:hypothetical protein
MQEKRGYQRYVISGSVILKFEGNDSSILKVELVDIGFIGFSVYSRDEIALGQIVQFEIIPELMDNSLIGKGRIKDIAQVPQNDVLVFRVGIEFIDVEKDIILKLININQAKIVAETERHTRQKRNDFGPY